MENHAVPFDSCTLCEIFRIASHTVLKESYVNVRPYFTHSLCGLGQIRYKMFACNVVHHWGARRCLSRDGLNYIYAYTLKLYDKL